MGFVLDTAAVLPQADDHGRYLLAPAAVFADAFAAPSALRPATVDQGPQTFDGSAYEAVVTPITGIPLLQMFIAPDDVARMSAALDAVAVDDPRWAGLSRPERQDVVRWFQVCRAHGYGIRGSLRVSRAAAHPSGGPGGRRGSAPPASSLMAP